MLWSLGPDAAYPSHALACDLPHLASDWEQQLKPLALLPGIPACGKLQCQPALSIQQMAPLQTCIKATKRPATANMPWPHVAPCLPTAHTRHYISQKYTVCRTERLKNVKAHPLLRRHVFYAHRDLQEILDCYEKGIPF